MTLNLPLGFDNFKEIIDKKLDFVDKSLFIKEILDDRSTKAAVITRPRRFGKTLNLSMLHHFLAAEVNGQSTKGLFHGLKIASLGDEYQRHQGQYPVIVVFGDLKKNETAAWSLLLMAGYLKVTNKRQTEMGAYCRLSIPNREVRGLYRGIIEQWLSNGR